MPQRWVPRRGPTWGLTLRIPVCRPSWQLRWAAGHAACACICRCLLAWWAAPVEQDCTCLVHNPFFFLLCLQDGKPTGGLLGMLSNARAAMLARFAPPMDEPSPSRSSSSSDGAAPPLPHVSVRGALPWIAGVTAIAALGLYAAGAGRSWWLWQQQQPLPPEMAEAAAAIGLPEYAVRPHYSAEQQPQQAQQAQQPQRRGRQQAAAVAAPERQQGQSVAAISKEAATRLVQQWLVRALGAPVWWGCWHALQGGAWCVAQASPSRVVCFCFSLRCLHRWLPPAPLSPDSKQSIKVEAMGPYHSIDRLQEVRLPALCCTQLRLAC